MRPVELQQQAELNRINKGLATKQNQEKSDLSISEQIIKVHCCICDKEFELSSDQLTRYNRGIREFYCSQSYIMHKSLNNIDIDARNKTFKLLYEDENWVETRTNKTRNTNIEKYGTDDQFKRESIKLQAKSTKLEKYGDECYNNRQQAAKTFYEHYSDNPILTRKISKINKQFFEFIQGDEFEFPIDKYNYDIRKGNILFEIDPSYTHHSLPKKLRGIYRGIKSSYHKIKSETAVKFGYTCIHVFD